MNKSIAGIIVLWGITLFLNGTGFSFTPDWMDVSWVLALFIFSVFVIWRFWKSANKYYLFSLAVLSLLLFIAVAGEFRRPSNVYVFERNYCIKAYVEITGFMDAGTSFYVYQRVSALPFIERKLGSSVNWETDYINRKLEAKVVLTNKAIIVSQGTVSDTLLIYPVKYPF